MRSDALIARIAFFAAIGIGALACETVCGAENRPASRNWWAFEEHGDKPGTGYVLIEKDGTITGAHFFIFMPDPSEDESGRFFRMNVIKQQGRVLIAEIKAIKGHVAEEHSRVRIEFHDAFGDGKRVRAEVTDPDKDRAKQRVQDVIFVLQGDHWGNPSPR
jgi:hypothetical protein